MTIRRYHILFRFEDDEAAIWDRRLTEALNAVDNQKSLTDAYNTIFEAGLEVIEQGIVEDGIELRTSELAKALREIEGEKAERRLLARLYEELGMDGFVQWCKEHNRDWQTFLDQYDQFKQGEVRGWPDRARFWLRHYLRDGEPHHTDDIKKAAIAEGILSDLDEETLKRDWSKLRMLASRGRFTTGDKGFWQYEPEFY